MADPLHDPGVPTPSAGATFVGPFANAIRVAQEKTNWCWAAATQMLRRHLQLPELQQCKIAGTRLGMSCCAPQDDCNVKLGLNHIEDLLMENRIRSRHARKQLDEAPFWEELNAHRPLLLADIFENGVDAHVRVLFGGQLRYPRPSLARGIDPANGKPFTTTFDQLRRSRWRETWHHIEVRDGEH